MTKDPAFRVFFSAKILTNVRFYRRSEHEQPKQPIRSDPETGALFQQGIPKQGPWPVSRRCPRTIRNGLSSRQKKYIGKSKTLSESIGKALKDEFKKGVIYREMSLPILISIGATSAVIEYPSAQFITYDQPMKMRLLNAITSGLATYGQ